MAADDGEPPQGSKGSIKKTAANIDIELSALMGVENQFSPIGINIEWEIFNKFSKAYEELSDTGGVDAALAQSNYSDIKKIFVSDTQDTGPFTANELKNIQNWLKTKISYYEENLEKSV